jgi:acetyltransferase-like isoleucine patch superfamily enzyme
MLINILKSMGRLAKITYRYQDDTYSDLKYLYFFFYQRILMFNWYIPWPVHFTSYIVQPKKINFGKRCSPGSSPFQYIQAGNGIKMGDNVQLAPGVHIISANHELEDYDKHIPGRPIMIGSNVWIGSNTVILPEVQIGDNVVIGAGSIVTKDIPSNTIAAGNPCEALREKEPYGKW